MQNYEKSLESLLLKRVKKYYVKRRNCSWWAISPFATMCSKVVVVNSRRVKMSLHVGKGLRCPHSLNPAHVHHNLPISDPISSTQRINIHVKFWLIHFCPLRKIISQLLKLKWMVTVPSQTAQNFTLQSLSNMPVSQNLQNNIQFLRKVIHEWIIILYFSLENIKQIRQDSGCTPFYVPTWYHSKIKKKHFRLALVTASFSLSHI